MGLDIYLFHCADKEAFERWEAEREQIDSELFDTVRLKDLKPEKLKSPEVKDPFITKEDREASTYNAYRNLPEEEQKARGKAQEEALLAWEHEHPAPCEQEEIRIDSKKSPGHMFKIGYLRSSYNDGGFNNVITNFMGGDGLYEIFQPPGDEYSFTPNWKECLIRAKAMRTKLAKTVGSTGFLGCMKIDPPLVSGVSHTFPDGTVYKFPQTGEEAIRTFRRELARRAENAKKHPDMASFGDGGYSNLGGEWFPKGFEILALLHGFDKSFGVGPIQPVVFAIYKSNQLTWYREALDITIEMIEWVLAQKDPEKYYIHWSG